MKVINQYKFKNNKILQVVYLNRRDSKRKKFPDCDNILFHWSTDNGKTFSDGLKIRPDEALIVAKMLIDAVYKTTKAYNIGLLKGYNGYTENKL